MRSTRFRFSTPQHVHLCNGKLIDLALERSSSYVLGDVNMIADDALRSLNDIHYVNIYSRPMSVLRNAAYRLDCETTRFLVIVAVICSFITTTYAPWLIVCVTLFSIISPLLGLIIMALIMDVFVATAVHESLHLFFIRRYMKSSIAGTVVIRRAKIYCLMPHRLLSPGQKLVIALAPTICCPCIGIMLMLISISFPSGLTRLISCFFCMPWLLSTLGFLPFSTDGKETIRALCKWITQRKATHRRKPHR